MLTLRLWVLVVIVAGTFAGLPLSNGWACDGDRFPCPIVSETPNHEADAPAQPAPRKKVSQPARQDVREQPKVERSAPRAAGGTKASKRTVQEQAANSPPQQAVEAAPAIGAMSLTDQSADDESQTEDRVANAAATWPVRPDTDGAVASTSGTNLADAAQSAMIKTVQFVDSKEVNELDLAADARALSWSTFLLIIFGPALAAGSATWFISRRQVLRGL